MDPSGIMGDMTWCCGVCGDITLLMRLQSSLLYWDWGLIRTLFRLDWGWVKDAGCCWDAGPCGDLSELGVDIP